MEVEKATPECNAERQAIASNYESKIAAQSEEERSSGTSDGDETSDENSVVSAGADCTDGKR